MATSRNKKLTQPVSASAYRSRNQALIELPSGVGARLRRPGMEHFLSAGYLPDTLRAEIQKQISSASAKKAAVSDLTKDMSVEDVAEWMSAMDRITVEVFIEPKVAWHQRPKTMLGEDRVSRVPVPVPPDKKVEYEVIPDDERDENLLYTDEMDMEDKQFAFQYAVGGSTDLARFRATAASLVDGLSAGTTVDVSAKRDPVSE